MFPPADVIAHTPQWHSDGRFERPDRLKSPLYVVTAVFNPVRYRSRWKLYHDFSKEVAEAGAILYTIEAAFGDRDFAVTESGNPRHIQLRSGFHTTGHELWQKERALMIGISRLPADWEYVATIDADVSHARHDWADEILHQLQHYAVVQTWSEAQQLSPDYEVLQRYKSFCADYIADPGFLAKLGAEYYYAGMTQDGIRHAHPGFSWAYRRDALNHLGGLMDWCVLGGADLYQAWALIGELNERTMPASLGATGVRWMQEWQNRAEKHIRRNIGCVPGVLLHHWHGKRGDRKYKDRGQILVNAQFDVEKDIKLATDGLWQLTDRSPGLRDDIRAYMRARNEDSIDVD